MLLHSIRSLSLCLWLHIIASSDAFPANHSTGLYGWIRSRMYCFRVGDGVALFWQSKGRSDGWTIGSHYSIAFPNNPPARPLNFDFNFNESCGDEISFHPLHQQQQQQQ
uniref:Putative secreted protein n=1 Tax=Anopheles darlingi TaxID=43151 RepID=A0A2M4D6E1_ANODA